MGTVLSDWSLDQSDRPVVVLAGAVDGGEGFLVQQADQTVPVGDLPQDLHFKGTIRIPDPPHSGAETVRLEDAAFSYDGKRKIFEHVNLAFQRGDKVGIIGYNGMGKTTLLKVLAGRMAPTEGTQSL